MCLRKFKSFLEVLINKLVHNTTRWALKHEKSLVWKDNLPIWHYGLLVLMLNVVAHRAFYDLLMHLFFQKKKKEKKEQQFPRRQNFSLFFSCCIVGVICKKVNNVAQDASM